MEVLVRTGKDAKPTVEELIAETERLVQESVPLLFEVAQAERKTLGEFGFEWKFEEPTEGETLGGFRFEPKSQEMAVSKPLRWVLARQGRQPVIHVALTSELQQSAKKKSGQTIVAKREALKSLLEVLRDWEAVAAHEDEEILQAEQQKERERVRRQVEAAARVSEAEQKKQRRKKDEHLRVTAQRMGIQ